MRAPPREFTKSPSSPARNVVILLSRFQQIRSNSRSVRQALALQNIGLIAAPAICGPALFFAVAYNP